ncbi:MAG: hypothetical protein KDK36_06315 [Leptospiraceae bacterium]|nr:hypothetical protein [Leptospiraceae bacterium]
MDTLEIFEKLKSAKFNETQARALASVFGLFAQNEPATKRDLSETELRLQKEIKEVDARLTKEMKDMDARLTKEMKDMDARLTKEIKEVDFRIKELEVKLTQLILSSKSDSLKWVIGAMFINTGLIVSLLKILD